MVNVPKLRNSYCQKCEKHEEMKVSIYKANKRNPQRQGERRYRIKQQGYGGQKRPKLRRKAKTTKKIMLKLECKQCHSKVMKKMHRAKHVILSNEKKVKGQALTY